MMETSLRRGFQRHTGPSFNWHRQAPSGPLYGNNVCKFWLTGNCSRNPCRFTHPDLKAPKKSVLQVNHTSFKQSRAPQRQLKLNVKVENGDYNDLKSSKENNAPVKRVVRLNRSVFQKSHDSPKKLDDNLGVEKKECKDLKTSDPIDVGSKDGPNVDSNAISEDLKEIHYTKMCEDGVNKSFFNGDGFSMVAQLEGHLKAVTGISLPLGSDKLISGSKDGTVRVWSCHTGECVGVADVGAPVECLISEGPWVFVGLSNAIKVWNIQTNAEFFLTSQARRVCAMVVANGMLLSGIHDGSILAWKINSESTSFDEMAPLTGHTNAVVSLVVGAKVGRNLYSGSLDNTIRVWDLETMQCIYTLSKHSDGVMSLLCWNEYLLSSSLDHTLKVWAINEAGGLEMTYEHYEEHGILSLCGVREATNKPILLCSCNDATVRICELPSFAERGRIFSKKEIGATHLGPGGLFFTGDDTGIVSVWKCS